MTDYGDRVEFEKVRDTSKLDELFREKMEAGAESVMVGDLRTVQQAMEQKLRRME